MTYHALRGEGTEVSTDPSLLDISLIHGFLSSCYWAGGIPREIVERSIRGSLCFGAYRGGAQIGFARVISDRATYAYVADVFVLEPHRGKGVGRLLMKCIMTHPELQGMRRWSLLTRDAHGLYRQFGFGAPHHRSGTWKSAIPTSTGTRHHE
ncbi:MAG TPA: GNAT family N-acetyltransferase [Bacteroidota bacterium]|nr:GNAT family N-acetyltransferase [Bacteroidota bacterium]